MVLFLEEGYNLNTLFHFHHYLTLRNIIDNLNPQFSIEIFLVHVSFRNPLITFFISRSNNFSEMVTTQDMRNLYIMFALCTEQEIFERLLSQKFEDYSQIPSP
jgi:hypothetical protein